MKRLIALSIALLSVVACKKEEVKPPVAPPPAPSTQAYPELNAGNGMWTVNSVITYVISDPTVGDTVSDFGTLQFLNDSVMIRNQNGFEPTQNYYKVNSLQTVLTQWDSDFNAEGPMTWSNANRLKFSFDVSEGSTPLRIIYDITRQ